MGKVITSFVVSKVTAIYLGPAGFAIIGNFKNVFQSVLGITSSGFESGVIRHIAEHRNNKKQYSVIISSVIALSIFISLIIAPVLYIYSDELSQSVLKGISYSFIFKYLAFVLPIISLTPVLRRPFPSVCWRY